MKRAGLREMRVALSLLVACAVLAGVCGSIQAGVTLVADGRPRAVIVVPDGSAAVPNVAAGMLRDHVRQMSGAELQIVKESDLGNVDIRRGRIVAAANLAGKETPAAFVLVGEGELVGRMGLSSKELGPGGIRILTQGNALILFGADEKTPSDRYGTHYAAAVLLERLGCRYLWPGESGKVVPQMQTIIVPDLDVTFTPFLKQRRIRNMRHGTRLQAGLDRLHFTKEDYLGARARAWRTVSSDPSWHRWHGLGGSLNVASGHAFGNLWHKYGKAHPEWFALQLNGSRDQSLAPTRPRLCKSNMELIEQIARDKIEEIRSHPDRPTVSIGPNDGGRTSFCMCDKCKALDPPEGRKITLWDFSSGPRKNFEYVSLTDRMVFFWNEIATRVTRVYPNALFGADAYSAYSAPPVRRTLHPNIVIRFVPMNYLNDEARQRALQDWDAWSKAAKKIYFRPNLLLAGRRQGALAVYVHKMARDFRYLSKHSMVGTDFDSIVHHWATEGLNYYVAARMNWNPDLDVDAVIDDYCKSGFGPAAAAVKQYFACVEALTDEVAAKKLHVTAPYTDAVLDELDGYLKKARQLAAGDEAVARRVAFLQVGLEWQRLEVAGHRLLAQRAEGKRIDPAVAKPLFERRFRMMRDILVNDCLAVNVGYVEWGEGGLWRRIGWRPSTWTPPEEQEADEQGRPVVR